jgi:hypothetical protein
MGFVVSHKLLNCEAFVLKLCDFFVVILISNLDYILYVN